MKKDYMLKVPLHFLPDKPDHSCVVVVFHTNERKDIYGVSNVYYSEKYGMFNCHDFFLADEADKSIPYNESVYAWAYMDDFVEQVKKEVNENAGLHGN